MEFKSNTLNQEVTQVYNHLIDADMKVLADEIWAAFLSKDAHKLVNALNHIQQELMNGGASQSPAYQETRKLYLKCKNMLHMHESKTIKKTNKMNYNESKEMHLRYPSTNNQKYFTPEQAEKMGYSRPEYNMDGSKPYEQWFNAKGQRIYVQRIDPLSDLRKNTGKSGFRMHESKTNKNTVKINENTLRQIVAESVKEVLNEGYGYDSSPMSGYEEFGRIGESAAYDVMRQLRSKYSNDVDEEAVGRIIDGFKSTLAALVNVGNDDVGIKGFGINYQSY